MPPLEFPQKDIAEYVAAISMELASLSRGAEYEVLTLLLEMVVAEANMRSLGPSARLLAAE